MWHIFLFSLVPLALVFVGVIMGSFDGIDAEREVFPTQPPLAEEGPPTTPGPSGDGGGPLQLTAFNLEFEPRALSAPSGGSITVRMDNRDAGVLHNFSLYVDNTAAQVIFEGELSTGPAMVDYTFDAPAPGTYFFRCDVHPDTMTGSFTVS
jgi:hypothetical protein